MSELKFSEAMRLGAALVPQCRGEYIHRWPSGVVSGACALGAVHVALADRAVLTDETAAKAFEDSLSDRILSDRWPFIDSAVAGRCPVCALRFYTIASGVIHLNDQHKWTRERIAEWVEPIEAAHDGATRDYDDAQKGKTAAHAAT